MIWFVCKLLVIMNSNVSVLYIFLGKTLWWIFHVWRGTRECGFDSSLKRSLSNRLRISKALVINLDLAWSKNCLMIMQEEHISKIILCVWFGIFIEARSIITIHRHNTWDIMNSMITARSSRWRWDMRVNLIRPLNTIINI